MDIVKKIKNYTINQRHCLGEGSFGKVYEAMSDEGRKVAIKRVQQKLICSDRYLKQSLDNQISIMQKLKHPNIVQLYQVIYTQNNIYLIMEYCSGGDLKRFCMSKKINQEIAFNIIRQITKGFEQLNKFGIIHRDLKAANILVHQDLFKICDFGFAKFFGEGGKMARTCVGTPIYMSPQVLKHKHYTSKTDVWSLGILFYQLLFGRLPYTGYNEQDLYRNIMKGSLQIPQCSKQALKILQTTLVVDEQNRGGWNEINQLLFNKPLGIQRARGNTPKQGIFYKDEVPVEKLEKKISDGAVSNNNQNLVKVPPITNNYLQEDPYDQNPTDRVKTDGFKKQARNIFAVQNQVQQARQLIPLQQGLGMNLPVFIERQPQENPRFFYFIFVEFIVNPIEGSLNFDNFLFNLWRYTIQLYDKLIERPELTPLYKNVLMVELGQMRNLQSELKVKKEGNVRKLGQLVFQQGRVNISNKKKLIWLKRFLDKKYTYEAID